VNSLKFSLPLRERIKVRGVVNSFSPPPQSSPVKCGVRGAVNYFSPLPQSSPVNGEEAFEEILLTFSPLVGENKSEGC
jgi:hypothetical protein